MFTLLTCRRCYAQVVFPEEEAQPLQQAAPEGDSGAHEAPRKGGKSKGKGKGKGKGKAGKSSGKGGGKGGKSDRKGLSGVQAFE